MSLAQRRLAAIMFTDIVGYTSLSQSDEALALDLLEEHQTLVRPFFPKHNGREIKTMGDAFLVEFASALEAVNCSVEIQQALRNLNFNRPSERKIILRIGIHVGDVVHSRDDVYGDAVNVASRIESLAEDGGVCLTRQVYDHVHNKFKLPLLSLGPKLLKNVSAPVEVYKMVMPWQGEKILGSTRFDRRRIAVLPFANISRDSTDEYFADGMTEELIATMSRLQGLRVIARTSVMGYKAGQKKINEVARELDVGTVLEGSVRKSGDKVRITVQLIDSSSSEHLWAESYDRELKDVLAIQTEIAKMVAEELKIHLLSQERAAIEKRQTVNPEAYTLYLKGRFYWNERTEENVNKAVKCFQQAVNIDPDFALAYSGLADSYNTLADYEWMAPSQAGVLAKKFSTSALKIDQSLAEAHASLGFTLMNHFWNFVGAEAEFKMATELRPSYAPAYHWYALLLFYLRRFEDARSQEERAIDIDPYSRAVNSGLSLYLAILGKTDEAMDRFHQVIKLNPEFATVHAWKSMVHAWLSEYDSAIEDAKRAVQIDDTPFHKSVLGWVYAVAGKKAEAQCILDGLELEAGDDKYVSPIWIAAAEFALGNTNEAFARLHKALVERDPDLLYFGSLPWFEEYRSDPRWEQIDAKMGISRSASESS